MKRNQFQLLVLCVMVLVAVSFVTMPLSAMNGPNLTKNVQVDSLLDASFNNNWLHINPEREDSSASLTPEASTSLNRDQSKALRKDARYYARDFDVSIDEAVRRLNIQEAIGTLNFELATKEADVFGGLYVEHQPVFRVVVLFTEDRSTALRSYIENGPLQGIVTTKLVEFSLRELETIQKETSEAFVPFRIPFEHDINIRENQVEFYVTEFDMAQAIEHANVQTLLGPDITLVPVDSLSRNTASIQGGRALRPECTTGFSVIHDNGTEGITTAGHCSNNLRYGSRKLVYQAGEYSVSGPYDVQWHTSTRSTDVFRPYITATGGSRPIYGAIPRGYQYVGEYVCKYGKTTKGGCGTIVSTNHNGTFIRVHSDTHDLGEGGDSGGPWYVGNYAYGVMTADFLYNYDAIYMAIDYIEILDLRLKTD